MNLIDVITAIAMRISFGQPKEDIREDLRVEGIGDSMFFWAWQAATWTPRNELQGSPMLSKSFKCSCVVQTASGFQNPDVIVSHI